MLGGFFCIDHLQNIVDRFYYRTDESVERGERLDWPVLWPKGTYVDIVQSSETPQLEAWLSLRSKLRTPQPARALRHPADLAKAFDKRVANAITLKIDHGPDRAQSLYQGFLRCIDIEKFSDLNFRLDSVSPILDQSGGLILGKTERRCLCWLL
jgi:hypothetical protein